MNQPIDTILAALRDCDCGPKRSGAGWTARCPAHDDANPSLSVGVGEEGLALIHCQAECDTSDVLAALDTPSATCSPKQRTTAWSIATDTQRRSRQRRRGRPPGVALPERGSVRNAGILHPGVLEDRR